MKDLHHWLETMRLLALTRVLADETLFQVASITAHDYRRP
jgi:hypothetical protein